MNLPNKCKITALVLMLFIGALEGAWAQEAILENIIVTNTRDDLIVYLSVEGAFSEKIAHAVLSGVPTTFSFLIDLQRIRNFWFNREVASVRVTHTVKYDNLKKEFSILRSWKDKELIVTASFEEAQKLMTEIDELKIAPLKKLKKGRRYRIRAKAEMSEMTLPFYLHYVLLFVSFWDFETDWYTVDFVY